VNGFELDVPPCYLCPSFTKCKLFDKFRDCLTKYLTQCFNNKKPNKKLYNTKEKLLRKMIDCYSRKTPNSKWFLGIKSKKQN